MTEQKNSGLQLPPPHERRILTPGDAVPPGVRMIRPNQGAPGAPVGPPGMPQAGPGGNPIQRIPHSGQPLTVAITFAPPPGMEQVPPNGVFWMHNGGVLMSQTIGMPALLDGVQRVDENGQVVDGGGVDAGPGVDRGNGADGNGPGANEEGGAQATTPSEPEPSS